MRDLHAARFTHTRFFRNGVGLTLMLAAVAILIFASPIAVRWIARSGTQWGLLSNVGQTYGFAAALLSGLALTSISVGLFYQSRQTSIAQLQAARTLQLELFNLAYKHPDLQEGWSRSVDVPYSEWRTRTYMNLVFMYLRMSYVIGETTDDSLRRSMVNRFKTRLGREYWETTRSTFKTGQNNRKEKRFSQIANNEYIKALERPPLEDCSIPKVGHHHRRPQVATFVAGGATVAIISMVLRQRSARSAG